ncbi:MAG: hypothetical protein WB792_15785 [Desulfobacterales bacterium]
MIGRGLRFVRIVPKAVYGVMDMFWPILTEYPLGFYYVDIGVRDVIVSFVYGLEVILDVFRLRLIPSFAV